jgi:hypothetical protein
MTSPVNRYLFKLYLLILLSLSMFPSGVKAQTYADWLKPKRPYLYWNAQLYPENKKYVQININPQDFDSLAISDVECEIRFYPYFGKPWTKIYKISKKELKYNTLKPFYVEHKFPLVEKAEGVNASYSVQALGAAFMGTSLGGAESLAVANCRDYKFKGLSSPPGTFKASDGTFRPSGGYRWVEPDSPANLCTQLKPNIVRSPDGKLRPAPGYQWVKPADKDDYNVEPIPKKNK